MPLLLSVSFHVAAQVSGSPPLTVQYYSRQGFSEA